jgi:hypothetical protein
MHHKNYVHTDYFSPPMKHKINPILQKKKLIHIELKSQGTSNSQYVIELDITHGCLSL